jgi:hypothetical protein
MLHNAHDKMRRITKVQIWQQNVRKLLIATLALLNGLKDEYDMVCIQEPHFDFRGITRATGVWTVVYLSNHAETQEGVVTRSLILIHCRISSNAWTQIEVASKDITVIRLEGPEGYLNIYNVYNDCTHSRSIQILKMHFECRDRRVRRQASRSEEQRRAIGGDIWLGEFNRHHPMWDDDSNVGLFTRANLDAAEGLIELVASWGMEMTLPKGIPTIKNTQGNYTRPDNVFCSVEIEGWITQCTTSPGETPPKADHFPIHTTVDFSMKKSEHVQGFNYRVVEWDAFLVELAKNLEKIPQPRRIDDEPQFHKALQDLTKVIRDTIKKVVPRHKQSPHSKRWWTKELDLTRSRARRAGEKAHKYRNHLRHPCHKEARRARNDYS